MRILSGLVAALAVSLPAIAGAQQAPDESAHAVQLSLSYVADIIGVVDGGLAQRGAFLDNLNVAAHLDLGALMMDDPTATQRLRELVGRASGIPIIAMTANALFGDRDTCLAAGMTDYVSKPLGITALFAALARAAEAVMVPAMAGVQASDGAAVLSGLSLPLEPAGRA